MTIKEALESGIREIRLSEWNDKAYLELPILENGMHGIWITCHDPYSSPKPIKLLIFELIDDNEDRFELR